MNLSIIIGIGIGLAAGYAITWSLIRLAKESDRCMDELSDSSMLDATEETHVRI